MANFRINPFPWVSFRTRADVRRRRCLINTVANCANSSFFSLPRQLQQQKLLTLLTGCCWPAGRKTRLIYPKDQKTFVILSIHLLLSLSRPPEIKSAKELNSSCCEKPIETRILSRVMMTKLVKLRPKPTAPWVTLGDSPNRLLTVNFHPCLLLCVCLSEVLCLIGFYTFLSRAVASSFHFTNPLKKRAPFYVKKMVRT